MLNTAILAVTQVMDKTTALTLVIIPGVDVGFGRKMGVAWVILRPILRMQ
jgi:hypothetical protein